jgi:hypothetical protein
MGDLEPMVRQDARITLRGIGIPNAICRLAASNGSPDLATGVARSSSTCGLRQRS